MRLLIAEDDSVSRLNLSAAVERFGHQVTAAADGAAAWDAMQKGEYTVVISDWDMPSWTVPSCVAGFGRGAPVGTCISF